jgi:hypothetical protein
MRTASERNRDPRKPPASSTRAVNPRPSHHARLLMTNKPCLPVNSPVCTAYASRCLTNAPVRTGNTLVESINVPVYPGNASVCLSKPSVSPFNSSCSQDRTAVSGLKTAIRIYRTCRPSPLHASLPLGLRTQHSGLIPPLLQFIRAHSRPFAGNSSFFALSAS